MVQYIPKIFIECARNNTGDTATTKTTNHLPLGYLYAAGVDRQ